MIQNCQLRTWNGYKIYFSESDFCLCFIMFHVCFVFHEYNYTPAQPIAKVEWGYTGFTPMSVRPSVCRQGFQNFLKILFTGENLDAVTAVTDSFKMAVTFAGDRTGGAVAQTSAQTIGISVWQGRVWMSLLQGIHGSGWRVVVRAKSVIVDPRDAAVTAPLFTVMMQ